MFNVLVLQIDIDPLIVPVAKYRSSGNDKAVALIS